MYRLARPALFVFFLSVLPALAGGCGRKALPVPGTTIVPPAVDDLTAEPLKDEDEGIGAIRLRWSITEAGGISLKEIRGFQLYTHEARDPASLCAGCPIPFRKDLFIPLRVPAPARVEGGGVILDVPYDRGYGYAYKVVTRHVSGGESGDSNIVVVPPQE